MEQMCWEKGCEMKDTSKFTLKQRRDRKRIANNKLSFAFVAMKDVDELLKFNKRLSEAAREIKFRICLLVEKLEKQQ